MKLACYFPAETPSFDVVDIDDNAYVKELLKAIYEELKSQGHDVHRNDLFLYKTDVPIEPDEDKLERARKWLHERTIQDRLGPDKKLRRIFSDGLSDDNYHIMIADSSVLELLDTLGDPNAHYGKKIRKDVDKNLQKLASQASPSDTVKTAENVKKLFDDSKVYRNQVPVALFNDILARFQARLEKNDDEVFSHDVTQAGKYIDFATTFYVDEKVRQAEIRKIMDTALGLPGQWGEALKWADGIKPDGYWFMRDFLSIVLELKNSPGIYGDPLLQCIVDFGKIIASSKYNKFRGACNFPVVLIGIAGSRLEISIAIYVGAIFVSDLVTINLSRGFHGSDTTIRLARIFKALASCLQDLKSYYERIPTSSPSDYSFLYPHPITANETALPPIKYDKYLGLNGLPIETVPDLGERSTAVYTGSFNGDKVLIKFTHRYNKKAHTLLAGAGLAPRLHFCNPIVGNLLMIVMDYIPDAKSVLRLRVEESPLPSIIPEQVEKAVTLLHNRDIVFGDLRDGNVIYAPPTPDQTDGRVMLVDFDWAGSHDIDRYSATLNPAGGWADGVSQYVKMHKEHDLWQLNRLKEVVQAQ